MEPDPDLEVCQGTTWTDILNQRKGLQRSASSSGFYESYAEQLRSYFLISLRYKFNRMN